MGIKNWFVLYSFLFSAYGRSNKKDWMQKLPINSEKEESKCLKIGRKKNEELNLLFEMGIGGFEWTKNWDWFCVKIDMGLGVEKGKELERKGWFVVTGFGERTKSQNVRKIGL